MFLLVSKQLETQTYFVAITCFFTKMLETRLETTATMGKHNER